MRERTQAFRRLDGPLVRVRTMLFLHHSILTCEQVPAVLLDRDPRSRVRAIPAAWLAWEAPEVVDREAPTRRFSRSGAA